VLPPYPLLFQVDNHHLAVPRRQLYLLVLGEPAEKVVVAPLLEKVVAPLVNKLLRRGCLLQPCSMSTTSRFANPTTTKEDVNGLAKVAKVTCVIS
jgi:hypothetical protein